MIALLSSEEALRRSLSSTQPRARCSRRFFVLRLLRLGGRQLLDLGLVGGEGLRTDSRVTVWTSELFDTQNERQQATTHDASPHAEQDAPTRAALRFIRRVRRTAMRAADRCRRVARAANPTLPLDSSGAYKVDSMFGRWLEPLWALALPALRQLRPLEEELRREALV